jgi:hypothetical protein
VFLRDNTGSFFGFENIHKKHAARWAPKLVRAVEYSNFKKEHKHPELS